MNPDEKYLHCPLCGQAHDIPTLKTRQRAMCVRCGATMAERGRLGPDAALAFAVTGLLLAIPSLLLPFVTLQKFGNERTTHLMVGLKGFWAPGFAPLGAWVLFCGALAPFVLLVFLVAVLWTDRGGNHRELNRRLTLWADAVAYWAMPEVQVLGVMVAFFKLGDVVSVSVGPGLWSYAAASFITLLAWRLFKLQTWRERPVTLPTVAATSA